MKTKLLFLSTLFLSFSINAQIDFEAHITVDDTGGTNNPTSVYAADLDGDGDMDMISSSINDSKLAWYKNTNGSFGAQQIITENAIRTNQVIAIDIDNDGDIDLVNATYYGIFWYENVDGQGNFGTPQTVSAPDTQAREIQAADMDGDGDLDITANSSSTNSIAWFENMDGQGTFSVEHIIANNSASYNNIYVEDLDSDGDMDILVSDYTNDNVSWFKNINGQGDFGSIQVISTNVQRPRGVSAADIDGDGDKDVLATSLLFDQKLVWYENLNGQGNFGPQRFVSADVQGQFLVTSADVDNDGYLDVISGSDAQGIIYWYKNLDGLGNFGPKQQITNQTEYLREMNLADLDSDGDLDLISASATDDKIAYYINTDGQGNFGTQNVVVEINGTNRPYTVMSIDMDGDGDKDVICASSGDDKISWLENMDGIGNFSSPKTISLQLNYPISIDAADIDGDGDMDVVSQSYYNNTVAWFENMDGQGTSFTAHIFSPLISSPYVTYPMDVDNDGDIDIVSGGDFGLLWYENVDSQGNFSPTQVINTTGMCIESVRAADIDSDGLLDLVAADWCNDVLFWHKNNGGGNFGAQQTISTEISGSFSVDIKDMDNDGDQDVLASSFGDHSVIWFENLDNQGTFGPLRVINNNTEGAYEVYAKDLDADGDMDVLTASFSSNTVFWHENLGSGNFGSEQIVSSQVDNTTCVFADDFNDDGKMDVLASSYSLDEIIWFENRGPLGTEENTTNLFSIYPNPTNGFLNIKSATPLSEITVYNNLGQLLFISQKKNQVDISILSKGIYFVKIKGENGQTETKKVIKN
ncbi:MULTISPECIES: T9SS type A sorting domain-containing protein [Aequorivita]|uniref:T9SS type A sorting domain-containing protein n=1 Tax=Aequorivita iocasae TaxID=2803865 RepID=A0ABX7DR56_9FLAO|nr:MULTISPECIES: T9SS type A sorting domain-containing protein [Aequorivita]QQX76626.1 T9SS type A sorting domain-containing protein [Aequorivita iocasae]UCA56097.1 T9SS type A sorting domain-containing protein [Aequorivita sp. F7]